MMAQGNARKSRKTSGNGDGDARVARVPYQVFVNIPLCLRVERLLGVKLQEVLMAGGSRSDVNGNALFVEAMERFLDQEEKVRDLDRTHPLPPMPDDMVPAKDRKGTR